MPGTVQTRFVLLSIMRSGTTAFQSALREHPDIYCHREVFRKNAPEAAFNPEFAAAHDLARLGQAPIDLAEALLSYTPGPPCVGFKLFDIQAQEVCARLLADDSVHKIILRRKNCLARYSSRLLMAKTGVAHALSRDQVQEYRADIPRVRFDREEFLKLVRRAEKRFRKYETNARGPVFKATSDAMDPEVFSQVFAFLELEDRAVSPALRRLNATDVLGRFAEEDKEIVRQTLDEIGHPDWVSE